MTEKTDGGRREEQGGVGRGGQGMGGQPRSYSEFMRTLAAKYNNENPAESNKTTEGQPDPRVGKPINFPTGVPFGFPPFLFPPSHLSDKDSPTTFPFLPGIRPPGPPFPPSLLPPGLLDGQAQALLSMMRAGGQNVGQPRPPGPPLDLSGPPPAKRQKRSDDSGSLEEPPVSPPPGPPLAPACRSLCSLLPPSGCSEEGRSLTNWSTEQVVEFVKTVGECGEYAEVFQSENIDGSVLVLLTDSHLQSQLGLKLGPALKLRSALAARLGNCVHCRHCKHCHDQSDT